MLQVPIRVPHMNLPIRPFSLARVCAFFLLLSLLPAGRLAARDMGGFKDGEWIASAEGVTVLAGEALLTQDPDRFVHLNTPTVWNAVSNLIAYRQFLYGVGSTVYVNHNSADVIRYDPRRDAWRYETRFFSQDAGQPAVHRGLLYYPAEDSRFSSGTGEYYVGNGEDWAWIQAGDAPSIHVHAMASHGGRLYMGAASWNGLLYASKNGGEDWERIYSHPTPKGRVTRINGLANFAAALYAGGYSISLTEHFLFRVEESGLRTITALPRSRWTHPLGEYQGRFYLFLRGGERPGLYKFDGRDAQIALPKEGGAQWRMKSVDGGATYAGRFYLAGNTGKAGAVWVVEGEERPRRLQSFPGREPLSLASAHGRLFIGMHRPKGRGELWVSGNGSMRGRLRSKLLHDGSILSRLRGTTPPGTALELRIAAGDGEFRGPDGTAGSHYRLGHDRVDGLLGPPPTIPYRVEIVFKGTPKRTPYLIWGKPLDKAPPIPQMKRRAIPAGEINAHLEELSRWKKLGDFWEIRPYWATLRKLALTGEPKVVRWIEDQIAAPLPEHTVGLFGGSLPIRGDWLLRHYLLMGLALAGKGRVPPGAWSGPVSFGENGAQKYFTPHEAGVFTAGLLRQDDPETVSSLLALLERKALPLWFKGDVVGALTRITGRRFGYDFARWRAWGRGK